ncbi:hypothetical protein KSP40_PGU019781 [Platanthera guangdongensis]|uniref:H15 domain-containing protein n=1 Tax=Platanthera guangdongensis TaxID=2320717 RepID=A0ABR2M3L9_9ASPA
MTTKKSQPPVAETVADPTPADPHAVKPAAGMAAILKQTKAKKPRKPRSPASHPPYVEMIGEAIASLKERTGSSQYAIAKFIQEKHRDRIPSNFKKLILFHLRKLAATGNLAKVKNSYKLPAAVAKSKSSSVAKLKAKRKPNTKEAPAKVKPSAAAKVTKPKPKTVAVGRPFKTARTSAKDAPVKKSVPKKPIAAKSIKKVKKVSAKKSPMRKMAN